MTYLELSTAAATEEWGSRVQTALTKAALAVAVDSPATELDIRRDRLARDVLRQPAFYLDLFRLPIALGFTAKVDLSESEVSDSEIDARIVNIANDFLFRG